MIAIYIVTKNMTVDQHTKGRARLREAGAPESAMKSSSTSSAKKAMASFRSSSMLRKPGGFDPSRTFLGPVMEELGIELAQPPAIMPIVDLVQP